MNMTYLKYGAYAVIGLAVAFYVLKPEAEQTADLGAVLDRTEFALMNYEKMTQLEIDETATEATPEQMEEFRGIYTQVMNVDPKFYDKQIGLALKEDGSFLGFQDGNYNNVQDSGEEKLFTVEIDTENSRLIATDLNGSSSGLRFSGTGFLAGAIVGRLLGRQRAAGIKPGAFANRNVKPRSSYKSPSSARSKSRSGGVRTGK